MTESGIERTVIFEGPIKIMCVNYTSLVTVMLRGIRVPAGFERDLIYYFCFLSSFHMLKLQYKMGGRL